MAELMPLPPAESCAHAVERFREALLLLTKRHEVEIEVGHIEPGVAGGGIEDLPDESEMEADYMKRFGDADRERKAWDKIEAWIDRAPVGEQRGQELRKHKSVQNYWMPLPPPYVLILTERQTHCRPVDGVRSLTVKAATRVGALESAAEWCEGQK